MDSDSEPMEVEYAQEALFVEDSEPEEEVPSSQPIPDSATSPEWSGMFEIIAVTSGESAMQYAGIDPLNDAIIEIEASPGKKSSLVASTRKSKPSEEVEVITVDEEETESDSTLILSPSKLDNEVDLFSDELAMDDQEEICSYFKGTLKVEDCKCLDYRQMLNGNVLDYWMHNVYHEKLTPEQRERSHFFDTTFFTTLAVDSNFSGWNKGDNKNLTAAEKRYNRVKDLPCNQNVNIFKKDFIVIPCLENEHWFLAIVCYPRMNGAFTLEGRRVPTKETFSCRPNDQKYQERLPIRQSCILIFDSSPDLTGRAVGAIMKISNFFKMTHLKKYKEGFEFKSTALVGIMNEVPRQSNNTDCGLFVLQFVENFFTKSPNDFRAPLRLANWFEPSEAKLKRSAIYRSIIESYIFKHGVHPNLPPVTLHPKK